MPLYLYRCEKCSKEIEKFVTNKDNDVLCECGNKCNRAFGRTHSRTRMNAKELFSDRISPDADRIMDNISRGKDRDFLDVCGEN